MRRNLLISILLVGAAPTISYADDEDAPTEAADPSGTADEPADDKPDGEAKKATRLEAAGEASMTFSSNVFREQNRRVDDFDTKNDPGERFYDMNGPADLVTRLALEGGIAHKLGKKRKLEAVVGGEYYVHARNTIANYAQLIAELSYDLTRNTALEWKAGFVPRRFYKNYAARLDALGEKVFEPAYAMSLEVAAEVEHRWSDWKGTAEYELLVRRFADPFGNRDRTGHDLDLELGRELSKNLTVGASAGAGIGIAPGLLELGVVVDRSYWQAGGGAFAEADLRRGWGVEGEVGYRLRRYTTDVLMDDAHYGRVDNRIATEAGVEKELGDHWTLLFEAGWTEQLSDRSDPTVDTDEAGYRELFAGAGVRGEL